MLITSNLFPTLRTTVEVFKTNLKNTSEAKRLKEALEQYHPDCRIDFDLEDCDKILRIEGPDIEPYEVERISALLGYKVTELPD